MEGAESDHGHIRKGGYFVIVFLWVILVLAAVYLAVTYYFFNFACRRSRPGKGVGAKIAAGMDAELAPYQDMIRRGNQFLKSHAYEDVTITSYDGLTLRARLYIHPNAKGVVVAVHGYRSGGSRDFGAVCPFYYNDLSCSILLIDQRACGQSEGKYITFGVRERFDVREWCRFIARRFEGVPIVLGGVSLGASTVLMASDILPDGVKVILADCGYVSAWEELAWVAGKMHVPAGLLLPGVDMWCRLLAGFGLKECTTTQSLAKNTRPVFFLHGRADELVPFSNTPRNTAACAAPWTLFAVDNAGHGMSFCVDPDGYYRAVTAFLDEHVF